MIPLIHFSSQLRSVRLILARLVSLGTALWLTCAPGAQEAVPPLINYQGRLLDGTGTNAPNGNYEIAFRVWSAGVGGTLIWGRVLPASVNSGIFNVVLGEGGTGLPGALETDIRRAFTDRERYLGITVTKDHTGTPVANPQEIVPRQQFLSTPFAVAAADSAALGGVPAVQYALVGGNATLAAKEVTVTNLTVTGRLEAASTFGGGFVPVGGIILWSGAADQIPAGWALCDGQVRTTPDGQERRTPDLRNRFVLGWGTRAPGATGGAESHALTVGEMPVHGHSYSFNTVGYSASWNGASEAMGSPSTGRNNGTRGRSTDAAGSGQAFSLLPPYYVLAFIQRIQ